MKKHLYKLLLAICFTSLPTLSFSQAWADMGTTWYYDILDGYIKLEKTADTLIQGKTCDVIVRTGKWYNPIENQVDSGLIGKTYTYFSDSTVFLWEEQEQRFYPLYKFNANIGDTWVIMGDSRKCFEPSEVQVDAVGYITIDGQSLRYITVKTISGKWSLSGRIIEKMGNTTYLLPHQTCISDVDEGTKLRCFNSNDINYSSRTNFPCDSFPKVGLQEYKLVLDIYPNPATKQIRISSSSNDTNQQIDIYNAQGQFIQHYQISGKETLIDISNYNTGVYVILSPNGIRSKFVKM